MAPGHPRPRPRPRPRTPSSTAGPNFTLGGSRFDLHLQPGGRRNQPADLRRRHGDAPAPRHPIENFDRTLRREPPYKTPPVHPRPARRLQLDRRRAAKLRGDIIREDPGNVEREAPHAMHVPGVRGAVGRCPVVVLRWPPTHRRPRQQGDGSDLARAPLVFLAWSRATRSTLDIRDPSETEENTVTKPQFVREAGAVELGHADLTGGRRASSTRSSGESFALQQPGKKGHHGSARRPPIALFAGAPAGPGPEGPTRKLCDEPVEREQQTPVEMGWAPRARPAGREAACHAVSLFQRWMLRLVNFAGGRRHRHEKHRCV